MLKELNTLYICGIIKQKIMKKFIFKNSLFSLNIFIIAAVSIFYLNTTKLESTFWGYKVKTVVVNDGCFKTETTYKTFYRFFIPTKDTSITNIKINDSKCY